MSIHREESLRESDLSMTKLKRNRSVSIKKKRSNYMDDHEEIHFKPELIHIHKEEVTESDAHKLASVLSNPFKGNFEGRYLLRFLKKNSFYREYLYRKFEPEIETVAMISLCSKLSLETYHPGQIVYKKGQSCNDKIYLLFLGEVAIFDEKFDRVPSMFTETQNLLTDDKIDNFDNSPKGLHTPPRGTRFSLSDLDRERDVVSILELDTDDKYVKVIDEGKETCKDRAKSLRHGSSFGEEIIDGNEFRTHNLVATKECIFAVLSLVDYNYIHKRYEKNTNTILKFLGMKFPSKYASEEAFETKIMNLVSIEEYPHGNYIICDGLAGEYFYLIYDGVCELQKKIKIPTHNPLKNTKFLENKNIGVSIIQTGAIFGDEIIFHEIGYEFSVKVTSTTAVVIAFNKKDFIQNFSGDPLFDDLREAYLTKREYNNQLMNGKAQIVKYGDTIRLQNNQPVNEAKNAKPTFEIWGTKVKNPIPDREGRSSVKLNELFESKKASPQRHSSTRASPEPRHREAELPQITLEEYLTSRSRGEEYRSPKKTPNPYADPHERHTARESFWDTSVFDQMASEAKTHAYDPKVLTVHSYRNSVLKVENKPVKLNDIDKKIKEITSTDGFKKELINMLNMKHLKVNFGSQEEYHREKNNEKLFRTRSSQNQRKKEYLISNNAWLEKTQIIQKEMTKGKINRFPEIRIKSLEKTEVERLLLKTDFKEKKINFKEFLSFYKTTYNVNPNSVPKTSDSKSRSRGHSRMNSYESLSGGKMSSSRKGISRDTSPTQSPPVSRTRSRNGMPKITIQTVGATTEGRTSDVHTTEFINTSVLSTEQKEDAKSIPLKVIMEYK